ncbi:universal stress protein [Methylobacterium nodulans]|uniref:UspA domain protein n=1 Tax=Methylobacterium nodulans (strain LMG 21967 / CNCM I-2342 / ORS 2060) TaxID=460265 RepID=B8IFK5_METNO|nr:universal stress protein [Methylobacterium nodulans]ACL57740.1 UspA domain protein [Methylobacterium nodulans ORS 2060]
MIKDLMVVVDGVGLRAAPYALSLARELGASICAAGVLPTVPFQTFAWAEIPYDMVTSAQQDARGQAADAAEAVARAALAGGLPCETTTVCEQPAEADRTLSRLAGATDLVVIEQPEGQRPKPADAHLETLLLRSGRPTLVVPYIHTAPANLQSAVVAWDASPTAARALADAIPLLSRIGRVQVVTVAGEQPPDALQQRLVRHLARHGIEAKISAFSAQIPVAEALLSHAADTGADLLVMGAYGHSPLREAILGGTSRTILESMTVPVLMSH